MSVRMTATQREAMNTLLAVLQQIERWYSDDDGSLQDHQDLLRKKESAENACRATGLTEADFRGEAVSDFSIF